MTTIPAAPLHARPFLHKWNACEHFAHLARHQQIFLARVHTILNEDKPLLSQYSAETDPEWMHWLQLSIAEIATRWTKDRLALIELIASLPEQELQRYGTHPAMGSLTLNEWLDFFLVHEGHHLYQIFKLWHASPES